MRRPLLVPVVQPVELGRNDPCRQQDHEDQRLLADSDVVDEPVSEEDQLGCEKGS